MIHEMYHHVKFCDQKNHQPIYIILLKWSLIHSVMNEGTPKRVTQTDQILARYKKHENGQLKKANDALEVKKIKSEIYDKILSELPNIKRPSIRRAVNSYLSSTTKPKKVEVSV